MKKAFLFLTFVAIGFAQNIVLVCPSTVRVGTLLSCTVALTSGAIATGVQYTVTSTPALGSLTATTAGTASAANKTTSTLGNAVQQLGSGPPGTLNATSINDGLIANLNIVVPASMGNQVNPAAVSGVGMAFGGLGGEDGGGTGPRHSIE